ncbi:MarR family winged helix-turn-helix transcriptional regulator [Acidicapsa dinghuensis]|uniref:MarR family winged helix-turn-helix transcriptional regulator n=1 Tax=Acidicapsa dinghuensis TaxID=2218256 RepID=A0ABW1ECI5_9BACT|nr:MarR family transcriptional regulator [Acidicapsa dinghuensis]
MTKRTAGEFENELDEDERRVTKLMKRIMTEFRARMNERLQPYGVTTAQVRLLGTIRHAPGSSGAQLSRLCEITPQSAQALIQRAEEAGWIVREKDQVNDRILTATLTPEGEKILKTADRVLRSIESKLWQDIPPQKLAAVIKVLETCLGNLTEEG